MVLPGFEFDEAATVAQGCLILSEFGARAKVIAGGTDVAVAMKKKLLAPERLVSIARIPELKRIDSSPGMLRLGPCVTIGKIGASGEIDKRWGAICAGARALGTPSVRNRATVGGNLGSARPAADMAPSLMAYGARVILTSKAGERVVSLENFFHGPGLSEMASDEILTQIEVDAPPPFAGASYGSLSVRSRDCNIVNVASFLMLEGPGGQIKGARIVLGCVGPTPRRALGAERALIGEKGGEALFTRAAQAAMVDCAPIDDFRGSAGYRKEMVGVLAQRSLCAAFQEALKS
ncbi:MAG: xanthine dehydrogenase family protein subunit M [Syntrophobacteraceae bacterium]|nr:xanthine dehydrogenase family protein subunit M [Syntrophobacteraceae bacterium]